MRFRLINIAMLAVAAAAISGCSSGETSAISPGVTTRRQLKPQVAFAPSHGAAALADANLPGFAVPPPILGPKLVDGFVSTSYVWDGTALPCFSCAPNPSPVANSFAIDAPSIYIPHNTTATVRYTLFLVDRSLGTSAAPVTCTFVYALTQGPTTRATYTFAANLYGAFSWFAYYEAALPATMTSGAGAISAQTQCPSLNAEIVKEKLIFQ